MVVKLLLLLLKHTLQFALSLNRVVAHLLGKLLEPGKPVCQDGETPGKILRVLLQGAGHLLLKFAQMRTCLLFSLLKTLLHCLLIYL